MKVDRLLQEMIAVPSVNPAFAPPGDPRAGEQRMAELVAHLAGRAGLDIEWQPVFPRRPNVLVRLSPVGKVRQQVLLAPHLDTVGAEDFTPRREHGRLHGRGACDTKGSVAAMLSALCRVAASGWRPAHTEIVLAGLVDEEWGQGGSREFAAGRPKAAFAIVGEPTRLQVINAHKGVLWLELATQGRAAHGSRPELGRNAIRSMARIVEWLEGDYADSLRRRRHRLLGSATVNVGSIQGGSQPNIVPAGCAITLDRRTLPGEEDAQVKREIMSLLRRRKLRASMRELQRGACQPLETSVRSPWVRLLMRCAKQRQAAGADFFTDAGVLAAGGIPSVVFGPGDIAQAHTADEWISLRSLERAEQILTCFLRSLP